MDFTYLRERGRLDIWHGSCGLNMREVSTILLLEGAKEGRYSGTLRKGRRRDVLHHSVNH